MKKGQKVKHSVYGDGIVDSIYAPIVNSYFKGGVTITLNAEGVRRLNHDRDNLYAPGNNDKLLRVFEADLSKVIKR